MREGGAGLGEVEDRGVLTMDAQRYRGQQVCQAGGHAQDQPKNGRQLHCASRPTLRVDGSKDTFTHNL